MGFMFSVATRVLMLSLDGRQAMTPARNKKGAINAPFFVLVTGTRARASLDGLS